MESQRKIRSSLKAQQWGSKRTQKNEAEECQEKGLRPYKVEVTKNNKIDGAYDRKNAWDNAIKGLAPCLLNLAVVKVSEQNPMDMAKLQRKMDKMFEYANHKLKARGFKDYVRCFMKGEHCCLNKRYSEGGQ